MKIILDGKEVERDVDCLQKCSYSGAWREQPVLLDGEYAMWTLEGECHVVQVDQFVDDFE